MSTTTEELKPAAKVWSLNTHNCKKLSVSPEGSEPAEKCDLNPLGQPFTHLIVNGLHLLPRDQNLIKRIFISHLLIICSEMFYSHFLKMT